MLNKQIFYHNTLRKTVIAFGQLFSNIRIQRLDADGTVVQTLKVPLSYGPKEKWLVRIRQNPDLKTRSRVEITVPRLAFEIASMQYAASRHIQTTSRMNHLVSATELVRQYNPAPYDITFALHILTRNQDDGFQIIEQILPFFTPDYTVTVNDVPEMGITHDMPISLQGINYNEDYNGTFLERNAVVWTMNFVAKANIYGPVSQQGAIKEVIQRIYPNMPGFGSGYEIYDAKIDPPTAGPTDDYTILESWDNQPPTIGVPTFVRTEFKVTLKGSVPTAADLPTEGELGDLWIALDTGFGYIRE